MIKKQFEIVKNKIAEQAHTVFGKERRSHSGKRRFLEEVFKEQKATSDREIAMTIATLVLAKLSDISKVCGNEAVWDILRNN